MKVYNVSVSKVIGTGILAVCVLAAGVYATIHVSYDMGYSSGMNKIFEEQEIASQESHINYASLGGDYYIVGAEITEETETGVLFELINGETYYVEKEGLNINSVYYLTMDNNGTPDYYQDDEVVVVWEAK